MILRFEAEIGYKGPQNVLILLENLASAIEDPSIIDNKLVEDIQLRRVVFVPTPIASFISSPLDLIPKHNGGFRQIHYLSHPKKKSVNDHISDGADELRYTWFHEVLDLILKAGRYSIIIKRDVKDAFGNVPVAPQHQWLLDFRWTNKFYKETCLSFGLVTALFIFNLFEEGLHWILASYLR